MTVSDGLCGQGWNLSNYYDYYQNSIESWLKSKPAQLNSAELLGFMMEQVSAVYFLHQNDVFHGEISDWYVLKDMSESRLVWTLYRNALNISDVKNYFQYLWKQISKSNGQYLAPEVRAATEATTHQVDMRRADVYSLGVMFLEVANAQNLTVEDHKNPESYRTQIGQRLATVSQNYNQDIHEVIRNMVDYNPATRWSIETVADRLSRLTAHPMHLVGRIPTTGTVVSSPVKTTTSTVVHQSPAPVTPVRTVQQSNLVTQTTPVRTETVVSSSPVRVS
jgi:serine/threonine protein kinase